MKWIKILLLALGFYVLYQTIRAVGMENLWDHMSSLGWNLLPILAVYPAIFALDTMGWLYAFPKNFPKHVPFSDLFLIRIVGETMNAVIPFSASLGGEPLKAQLLKDRHGVPIEEGFASLLIVHTTFWVSLNLFVLGSIAFTFKSLPLTPILWNSVLAFLIGLGLVAVLLIIGLHWGIFRKVHEIGENFRWWGHGSDEKKERFLKIDQDIQKFYTGNRARFVFSTLFNFLGWFAGAFEVYFIANAIGMPIGFFEAWLLEALIQVLRIVTFFIPSSIGVQEGGIVLIFSQFGFPKDLSLTFAMIRRAREILWIAMGLALWSLLKEKRKPIAL